MNLTAAMAKNPEAFLAAARTDKHAQDAAIRCCDSREDLYHAARGMGLSDQQIIANANAEAHEEFDTEAWANGENEIEVDHDCDPALAARMKGFPTGAEVEAISAWMESKEC